MYPSFFAMNADDILYAPLEPEKSDEPPQNGHDYGWTRHCRKCGLDITDYIVDCTPCTS